jgi:hypothetical protein
MQTTIQKEVVLNKIMRKAREATQLGPGTLAGRSTAEERHEEIAKLRQIPDWSVPQYLESLFELSLPVVDNRVTSFTDRITDLVAQVRCHLISCDVLLMSYRAQ